MFVENFGKTETAVRVQIFDPFLFTKDFELDSLSWKIHFQKGFSFFPSVFSISIFLDFKAAIQKEKSEKQNRIPMHENVIKNFVNIELFLKEDLNQEDCVGWITIMEKAGEDLRTVLKEEKIDIEERKKIAEGILNGFNYLTKIGIWHLDLKLENVLLVDGIPKIIDYGLVRELTGRSGYRQMGYTRNGSKFRSIPALRKFI